MTDYQKNRLEVYNRKIDDIKMHSSFFKKNLIKVIVVGIGIALVAPFYSGGSNDLSRSNSQSIMGRLGSNYFEAVLWILAVYVSFCIIGHVVFNLQDKYRIRKFQKLKKELLKD